MNIYSAKPNRFPAYDVVKAIMMLWVVWGHLSLYGIVVDDASTFMLNAKIGVNMPIFFVISGYFASFSFERNSAERMVARVIHFMWPQIVYAVICAIVLGIAGFSMRSVFRHIIGFWFLHTLALIYILCFIIYRIARTDVIRWGLFVLSYICMLFCPECMRVWWCGQVIHMFPYFVFGLMVLRSKLLFNNLKASSLCGVIFICAVIFQGDSRINGMNFWKVNPYWEAVFCNARCFVLLFARTIVGITGSIFVLFLVNVAMHRFFWLSRLAVFGTTSLGVYVIHEYPLFLVGQLFVFLPFPCWMRWGVAIGWFIICHYIVVLITACKPLRYAFFGNEEWLVKVLDHYHVKEI